MRVQRNAGIESSKTMSSTSPVHGRHIDVNGVSLYVEEHGAGVPLVLVHGGTASSRMWDATVPLLAARYRVIVFDDRGHGLSSNPSGELSYRLIADDTAALIEALDLERPFVGGWSDGGQVALELGIHYPHLARGLIVGGAYTDFQSDAAQAMVLDGFEVGPDGIIDFAAMEREGAGLVGWVRPIHTQDETHWQRILQQTLTMWLDYPGLTQEQLAAVQTPSIVIHADRDNIPLAEALKIFEWLPKSELAVLPGSSHIRLIWEPATFVAMLIDFIERHRGDE